MVALGGVSRRCNSSSLMPSCYIHAPPCADGHRLEAKAGKKSKSFYNWGPGNIREQDPKAPAAPRPEGAAEPSGLISTWTCDEGALISAGFKKKHKAISARLRARSVPTMRPERLQNDSRARRWRTHEESTSSPDQHAKTARGFPGETCHLHAAGAAADGARLLVL